MLSHIKTEDDYITQIYSFDAPIQTNFDVWLIQKANQIQVAGDEENDFLILHYEDNGTIHKNIGI